MLQAIMFTLLTAALGTTTITVCEIFLDEQGQTFERCFEIDDEEPGPRPEPTVRLVPVG